MRFVFVLGAIAIFTGKDILIRGVRAVEPGASSSFPPARTEKCCYKKVVSGTLNGMDGTYFYKKSIEKTENCLDGCVYLKEGGQGEEYCFKAVSSGAADINNECEAPETFIPTLLTPSTIKQAIDWTMPWPCPMQNTTLLCNMYGSPKIVSTWQSCGYLCNRYYFCTYWTFDENNNECQMFASSGCNVRPEENSTSGRRNCPTSSYTVQDESSDALCQPCGSCPCCLGACVPILGCLGVCAGVESDQSSCPAQQLTVKEAKISAGIQISDGECSADCDENSGSKENCYKCVVDKKPDFDFYCIQCVKQLIPIIVTCVRDHYDNPLAAIKCIITQAPDSCKSCICDTICIIEPSLCKICHSLSFVDSESASDPELSFFHSGCDCDGDCNCPCPRCSPCCTDYSVLRDSHSKCDPGWFYNPNTEQCYRLFQGDPKNQSEAQIVCKNQEGCLVSILSAQTQNFINHLLTNVYGITACYQDGISYTNCIWSGGYTTLKKASSPTGFPQRADWWWMCGGIFSENQYINWYKPTGEPNAANGGLETAIMINFKSLGKWNNYLPDGELAYMCQKNAYLFSGDIESPVTSSFVISGPGHDNVEQKMEHHGHLNETHIDVPAHSDYSAQQVILQGVGGNNSVKTPLITYVRDGICQITDLPDQIDPQSSTKSQKRSILRSENIERVYHNIKNSYQIAQDSEEYNQLSSSVQNKCAGKSIWKGNSELHTEESWEQEQSGHLKINLTDHLTLRLTRFEKDDSRQGDCVSRWGACLAKQPNGCFFWTIDGSTLNKTKHFHGVETNCASCLKYTDPCSFTPPPNDPCVCSKITTRETFNACYYKTWYSCPAGFPILTPDEPRTCCPSDKPNFNSSTGLCD